ncbi:MAG: RNA 3'-terminal phosphate cyclase [Kofleriaceae bacterium]
MNIVEIDGSLGEGGGQVLRTSLALSMITGRPLRMQRIRAGRAKPGLRRQHLACVEAAAKLCGAEIRGAEVGSQQLWFSPGAIVGGDLMIDIGTPGSTTLVVQTIANPAIIAERPITAIILGGTHNPLAPPFEFLDRVFLPHLRRMGASISLSLDRHGFASGESSGQRGPLGQITLSIAGGSLRPISVVDAGPIVARRATAIIARLPTHVAERELAIVRERLGATITCEVRDVRASGPANLLMIEIDRANGRELVTHLGERGLRAELVASRACDELAAFVDAGVPVGEHLADQLLLPMAVAGGGAFRTRALSLHATTNIATIQRFLDVPIRVELDGDAVVVTIG